MRTTRTCRECNCRKLWRVHPVMLPQFDSKNALYPVPAVTRSSEGTTEHAYGERQEHGTLEMWICTACGLTEWYSVDVNTPLSILARQHGSGVTFVDGDAPAPFR